MSDSGAIAGPERHINGVKEVVFKRGGTWNGTTCTAVCHEPESWRGDGGGGRNRGPGGGMSSGPGGGG